ncbi:hypothetical protein [Gottfriedia acidiceleris]|uniref:Uncharacterized protein n=1 Tax=Gottfriedia acidiceleris TaxID=371036 RepID=A0ABY4JIJ7_9BACI|nr:hypothetical protein [Gottfriedia acidiceleris]UPM53659.1 hypothetical protein MY490_18030 [Gottfriedia acidiceleris]
MNRTEIMEEISDFLIIYLKDGKIGINSFIKKAQLNISQFEQLLMIHYLLRDDVKQFVRELPILIRNFKTSTRMTNETYMGEVRGQIHWSNTVKERLKINHLDHTIFSCNESIRSYDITENLVLKELLYTLYNILFFKIDTTRLENYSYFSEWKILKDIVEEMIRKNIYLSKVDSNHSKVTNRMIMKTLRHRNSLYNQAAKLLMDYREIMTRKIDKEVLEALITETFIFPEKEEVLFELFWVIQLIKNSTENARLRLIDGRNNLVASWETDGHLYQIYHNSTGSSNISFNISSEEVARDEHPFIMKKLSSMKDALRIAKTSLQSHFDVNTFWRGRPDIIVEVYTKGKGELLKIIIGEVKDTDRTEYAVTGLRELMDYMELIKDNHEGVYVKEKNEEMVEGKLFIGMIDVKDTMNERIKIHSMTNKNEKSLNVTVHLL